MSVSRIPVPTAPGRKGRTEEMRRSFEEQLKTKEAAIKRRRELWEALSRFIQANHGWLVSAPHEATLRVETKPDSDLIDLLAERGFNPRLIGSATKVVGGKFIPIHCYNLTIK